MYIHIYRSLNMNPYLLDFSHFSALMGWVRNVKSLTCGCKQKKKKEKRKQNLTGDELYPHETKHVNKCAIHTKHTVIVSYCWNDRDLNPFHGRKDAVRISRRRVRKKFLLLSQITLVNNLNVCECAISLNRVGFVLSFCHGWMPRGFLIFIFIFFYCVLKNCQIFIGLKYIWW